MISPKEVKDNLDAITKLNPNILIVSINSLVEQLVHPMNYIIISRNLKKVKSQKYISIHQKCWLQVVIGYLLQEIEFMQIMELL